MHTLIVLFRLQAGVDVSVYEQWARSTDLPVVRKLPSVDNFELFRTQGLFGADAAAPFDYVEMIEINDLTGFGRDVQSATMRRVAGEFRQFADQPVFMLANRIGAGES